MKNLDFEWLTDEFMLYCRSTQLREKTMSSYEQTLHLFGRWLSDELKIYTVDKITENVIRKYIDDLMVRGKYTLNFYTDYAMLFMSIRIGCVLHGIVLRMCK